MTKKTALVYCDQEFGRADGKTAVGLVRYSDLYTIVGILDRSLAGQDAGEALGEATVGIPIFASLDDALGQLLTVPQCYIYGKAPLETSISQAERTLILEAMAQGMDIINGLHQFFSEDPEFVSQAAQHQVQIQDIRKPPLVADLHGFTGEISRVTVPVVAVLGTDCACGKMTTALKLHQALMEQGLKSVFIATGQTGLMQGAKYGIAIDALVSQFVVGEIEHAIVQAFDQEDPDIILVEGQSAVSHPAFMSSLGILKGSLANGVILQHPPARKFRCDFPHLAMPTVAEEINLIETISAAKVIAITLSHEDLTHAAVLRIIADYERSLQLPTTDVLDQGCQKLVAALCQNFPQLQPKIRPNPLAQNPLAQNPLGKVPVLESR
ncbi:DUF1611 domain-containing protein [Prochlorothrix hollandica]|uniref:DUF1611 domain-containing protein n=1 Tax=Prochlorothrix hollandica TaxID=1223 RepID=UPI003342DD40